MLFILFLLMNLNNQENPRQVIIFYTSTGEKIFDQQIKEFDKYNPGVKERDIQVKKYLIDTVKKDLLRQHDVEVKQAFTFILIGRDGGEKFRSDKFVKAEELFAIIDAMPMRKSEMKKGKSVGN